MDARARQVSRRPRFRSGLAFSVVLHLLVLGSLGRLAGLAPAPVRFDVFAADPVDASPRRAAAPSSAKPPRPRPVVAPPKRRLAQPARRPVSSVRAGASAPAGDALIATSARPPDPPVGPTAAAAAETPKFGGVAVIPPFLPDAQPDADPTDPVAGGSISLPSIAPAYSEAPLSLPANEAEVAETPAPAPESLAELEHPTAPSVASMALPGIAARAEVLQPVPGMPIAVAVATPAQTASSLQAAAIEQQPAEPPREMAVAPARPEPPSAPATTAGEPAPLPVPPPTPVAMPEALRPLAQSAAPESLAEATGALAADSAPPLSPPIPGHVAGPVPPSAPAEPAADQPLPPAIASAVPTALPRADSPAAGSSPLGLGLGRLRIRLDGASMRATDRETDVISGTLVGGQPERVVVQVGDQTSVPSLAGRAFASAVKLSPGVNRVRVLATDAQGAVVEEVVTVQYDPPVKPVVAITSPSDGHTLAADDPPLVTVQGEVTDTDVSAVWIVANDRRVMIPVTAGRFRHVLPALEPTVRVRAETGTEGGGSATVTVDATAALPAIGLFLSDWPRHSAGPAQMTVTWRPHPARLDGGAPPLPLRGLVADTGDVEADFFYLRNARPGVYTFSLTYRAGATPPVHPVLSVAGAPRSLRPVTLDGSGRAVVARLLLPHGVMWEDDDWFTGRSASGDTVTKFRFPEGVSWIERLGDLGR